MPSAIKAAVVGCGSVSRQYIPSMMKSPYVEVVAVCDAMPERAREMAKKHGVGAHYEDFNLMLDREEFDILVNLTGMQTHAPLNRKGLESGRHVWSEKPLANSFEEGQELLELAKSKELHLWGAPFVVGSPTFAEMARVINRGEIGSIYAGHGFYGWSGPTWGKHFYRKGGGPLPDLGVYNITTLTGLLGPAKSVVAVSGTALPERIVDGEKVRVEVDDNVMLLMDHGNAVLSSVQTGFVYKAQKEDWTIHLTGLGGAMAMRGYDWEPKGVDVWTEEHGWHTRAEDQQGWHWAHGVNHVAQSMVEGKEPLVTGEHGLHVVEIMEAALESAATGRRVDIRSSFPSVLERIGT